MALPIFLILVSVFEVFALVSSNDPNSCGNTWCQCYHRNRTAICQHHGTKLTFIPKLPTYVKHLRFENNFLPRITTSTFGNVTNLRLKTLEIRFNQVFIVTKTAFTTLLSLTKLDLSGNSNISSTALTDALKCLTRSKLSYLSLKWLKLKDKDISRNLEFKYLRTLELDANEITVYIQSDYSNFPKLQVLSLRDNKIVKVSLSFSSKLQELDLSDNQIQKTPDFCYENGTFPNLLKVRFDHNVIKEIDKENIRCLQKLVTFSLNSNLIFEIKEHTFSELMSLKNVYLSHLNDLQKIEKQAFTSNSIEILSFAYSSLIFKNNVHKDAFLGCPSLRSLDLNGNMLHIASQQDLNDWFGHLTSLTSFALGNCYLNFFPNFISQKLLDLEHLSLHGNAIDEIPTDGFTHLKHLTILGLARNDIAKLDERIFPEEVRHRLKKVILAHNPFACNCELLWFLAWTKQDSHKFMGYPSEYVCASPGNRKGMNLRNVDLTTKTCYLSSFASLIIAGCCGLLFLFIIIVSITYRWRWHIRYYVYRKTHKQRENRQMHGREIEMEYDAYVIYSADNIRWIKNELIAHLEEAGLKLYIRDRDSMAGVPIVDNVVNNMSICRSALVILSNSMAKDEQCQFELMFIQRQEEGQRSPIILVLLEEVQAVNVTQSVYALVKMHSYISWSDEPEARDLFWNRLQHSLNAGQGHEELI